MYELEVDKIFEGLYRGLQGATKDTPNIKSVFDEKSYANEKSEENQHFQPLHNTDESGYEGAYKGLPSNKVISNKEEIISNKQKEINKEEEVISTKNNSAIDFKTVIKVFENNIHRVTPLEHEKLLDFISVVSCEVIIMAIEEAVNYNARTIKYISKILNCWIRKGIKTVDDARAYQREWENRKNSYPNGNGKKSTFCDYDQRQYDFDELEKKLLGWNDSDHEG